MINEELLNKLEEQISQMVLDDIGAKIIKDNDNFIIFLSKILEDIDNVLSSPELEKMMIDFTDVATPMYLKLQKAEHLLRDQISPFLENILVHKKFEINQKYSEILAKFDKYLTYFVVKASNREQLKLKAIVTKTLEDMAKTNKLEEMKILLHNLQIDASPLLWHLGRARAVLFSTMEKFPHIEKLIFINQQKEIMNGYLKMVENIMNDIAIFEAKSTE